MLSGQTCLMDCCRFVQFWCLQNLITAVSRVSRQVEALVEQHLQLKQELRGLAELRHQNRQLTDKVCYYARSASLASPVGRASCQHRWGVAAPYSHRADLPAVGQEVD